MAFSVSLILTTLAGNERSRQQKRRMIRCSHSCFSRYEESTMGLACALDFVSLR
ncbi:MAG TPA: hypothetical protein V6C93_19620 [Allocoleopsis sp.]